MNQQPAEQLFGGSSEMVRRMRSINWSQTLLGAIETWSDSVKTTVQILLTELSREQAFEETQGNPDRLSQDCNLSVALPEDNQSNAF